MMPVNHLMRLGGDPIGTDVLAQTEEKGIEREREDERDDPREDDAVERRLHRGEVVSKITFEGVDSRDDSHCALSPRP